MRKNQLPHDTKVQTSKCLPYFGSVAIRNDADYIVPGERIRSKVLLSQFLGFLDWEIVRARASAPTSRTGARRSPALFLPCPSSNPFSFNPLSSSSIEQTTKPPP